MNSFVDIIAVLSPGGIAITAIVTWLTMRNKTRNETEQLIVKHNEEMERLRLDRDNQVYLRLERENERVSKENDTLRGRVDELYKEIAILRSQLVKAGLAPALWEGGLVENA